MFISRLIFWSCVLLYCCSFMLANWTGACVTLLRPEASPCNSVSWLPMPPTLAWHADLRWVRMWIKKGNCECFLLFPSAAFLGLFQLYYYCYCMYSCYIKNWLQVTLSFLKKSNFLSYWHLTPSLVSLEKSLSSSLSSVSLSEGLLADFSRRLMLTRKAFL